MQWIGRVMDTPIELQYIESQPHNTSVYAASSSCEATLYPNIASAMLYFSHDSFVRQRKPAA